LQALEVLLQASDSRLSGEVWSILVMETLDTDKFAASRRTSCVGKPDSAIAAKVNRAASLGKEFMEA
jgi:hypothetical protein